MNGEKNANLPGFRLSIFALLLICTGHAAYAQDDYLSTLEAEADRTTVLERAKAEHEKLSRLSKKKTTPRPAQTTKEKKPAQAGDRPAGQAVKKFEEELYTEFPGNFAVYSSLTDEQKQAVYDAYRAASDKEGLMRFGPALGKILDLASQ